MSVCIYGFYIYFLCLFGMTNINKNVETIKNMHILYFFLYFIFPNLKFTTKKFSLERPDSERIRVFWAFNIYSVFNFLKCLYL